ncbi:MAG: hypothetical protein ACM3VX_02070 [Bacteroidota bacterium]
MADIRNLLSHRPLLMNLDLMVIPPGVVVNGLLFIWKARRNYQDWDWLIVLWIATILSIVLLGLLWRRGTVTLEVGMLIQTLVYVVYLEASCYHFWGYFSVPWAIFNVYLIMTVLIGAYNAGERECDEQKQFKDSG